MQVDWETSRSEFAVLRGLPQAGDPLRMLAALLCAEELPRVRRWLIDGRLLEEPVSVEELDRLVKVASSRPEELSDLWVAWVGKAPWSGARARLASQLPFELRCFRDLASAERWLRTAAGVEEK